MQAIREKLSDMSAMRKAKSEAKEDEQAEKELAKTRVEVAHEVRLAREAEAAMDLHVNKAAEKVAHHEAKHMEDHTNLPGSYGGDSFDNRVGADYGHAGPQSAYGGGTVDYAGGNPRQEAANTSVTAQTTTGTTRNSPGDAIKRLA